MKKKYINLLVKFCKNEFSYEQMETVDTENIPTFLNRKILKKEETEKMIEKIFFSIPQKLRLKPNNLLAFLYNIENDNCEKIGYKLFKKISRKDHFLIKKMLTNLIKEKLETKIYFENNVQYNFNNVITMLEILVNQKENASVKIEVKEITHENQELINDIKNNLARAIKLINNNKRIYNLKYVYNGTLWKDYHQSDEEDSYLFDYITAISNILFAFNDLLLKLVYDYSYKNNVSHLITKDNQYSEKLLQLENEVNKILKNDLKFHKFLTKEKDHFFQNIQIMKNNDFINDISKNIRTLNLSESFIFFDFSNNVNIEYQKNWVKNNQTTITQKTKIPLHTLTNVININNFILKNKSIKEIFEILYDETHKQIKNNPEIAEKKYYINIFINTLNERINDLKKEYEQLNKKSQTGHICLSDDLFNKDVNNNSISKLIYFFVKNELVPKKFHRIFTLYEIMFRHQYAHGCNDYFKNALLTHRKVKFSTIEDNKENNLQFTTTISYFYNHLEKISFNKIYDFYKKQDFKLQEKIRIELAKFNSKELVAKKENTAYYNAINNHLFEEYFNKEKRELIFPFQKSNHIDILKNELNFVNNEDEKQSINNKIKLIENITNQFRIENCNLSNLDDYIFFDDCEEISLSHLVEEIVSFLNYYYHNKPYS